MRAVGDFDVSVLRCLFLALSEPHGLPYGTDLVVLSFLRLHVGCVLLDQLAHLGVDTCSGRPLQFESAERQERQPDIVTVLLT